MMSGLDATRLAAWLRTRSILSAGQRSSAANDTLFQPRLNHFCPNSRVVSGEATAGAIMRQVIYCVSLIAIWLCSTATIICFLNFGALGLVLIVSAGFALFFSSVALVEEFVEWRRHTEPSPVKRLLLPPAS